MIVKLSVIAEDLRLRRWSRRLLKSLFYDTRTDRYRDLNLPAINNLTIQQQQQQTANAFSHNSLRPTGPPIPAPVPHRAPVPPMQPAQVLQGGMWSPEMGIKFGGPAPTQQPPQAPQNIHGGQWDPRAGVRFG